MIDLARDLLREASAVTVLTGAGISTDSGIPDFRGPNGLWLHDEMARKASHISTYRSSGSVREENWRRRASGDLWATVAPNAGHRALVALERQGKLEALITQNVDELHQQAGSDPAKVLEVHGTTRRAACLDCDYNVDMDAVLDRVRRGERDPDCPVCGGILKSATVSFGQSLDGDLLRRAHLAAERCDVFLAVGSSLTVFPINETVRAAHDSGASVVILNAEPTPFDDIATVVLHRGISETLPTLVGS